MLTTAHATAAAVRRWVAMHGPWSVTSEDAKCERRRKSKIRARLSTENHESYNFYDSTFCVISTVRRTSGPPIPTHPHIPHIPRLPRPRTA